VRVEAVITTPGKVEGKTILMVSTAPIRTYGKDLAPVFLEDLTEFRRKRKTGID
jgi:hypothetical protein